MDQFTAMRIFRQVVEQGGFSAAAEALDISHTVVSRQVRQLEESLGAQLLNRTTRRLALTEVGQEYYRRCIDILELVADASRVVTHHQARPAGILRINAPMAFGTLELSKWLPQFLRQYPELGVDIVCNDRFVDLITEEFDVGLRITRTLPDSTLIAKKLTHSDLLLVAAPAYLQQHGTPLTLENLATHNYLAYSLALQTSDLSLTDRAGQMHQVCMRGNFQANSGVVVTDAVRAGLGITAAATFVIHEDLRRGDLVRVLPDYQLQARDLYVLYPQNRHMSPKVRVFVDFVTQYYSQPRWQ